MDRYRAIPEGYMTVGEVAKKMGVSVRTLQYYDREGLLSPSAESDGGRRLYTEKDVVRLHQILSLKSLGFSLEEIGNSLSSLETPEDVAEALSRQAELLREKIEGFSRALNELEALREEVLQMRSVDFKNTPTSSSICRCATKITASSNISTENCWTISAPASTGRAACPLSAAFPDFWTRRFRCAGGAFRRRRGGDYPRRKVLDAHRRIYGRRRRDAFRADEIFGNRGGGAGLAEMEGGKLVSRSGPGSVFPPHGGGPFRRGTAVNCAISVENLQKSYKGRAVLKGVSFCVERGEIFALLGVNGAGKTTALECIEGLRKYDGGKIRVCGRTGIQLQSSSLPAHIRAVEAVRLFAARNGRRADERMLSALGVDGFAKKQYGGLSEGQKRRLHLALALVRDPDVLFLDEPTAGLDVEGRASLHG